MRIAMLFFVVFILSGCSVPQATRPADALPVPTRTQPPAPNTPIPTQEATAAVTRQETPATVVPSTSGERIALMTPDQLRCVASQIGKERIPQIQKGDTANSAEEAVIEACFNDATAQLGKQPNPPAEANKENLVFNDETWITSSSDGIKWQVPVLLDTAASVPEILALPDGSLLAMWCSFKDKPARFQEKLAVARLPKGATEWVLEGTITIPGAAEANITFVDPDLLLLPDGRIRLYAYNIQTDRGEHVIVSAISSDNGQTFTLEEGVRFTSAKMWDPNVIMLPDGSYRMYYNGDDAIRSASSQDGLSFTADAGERWIRGAIPGALVEGDTIWLYGCEKGISRRQSRDGLEFSPTEQVILQAQAGAFFCDPSITKSGDTYWLILKKGVTHTPPKP
jgi:hypothetical protein